MFSTYLYTGTGATQTITNNIDLSTEGGLVWIKPRSFADNHSLFDTARGALNRLRPNDTTANVVQVHGVNAFNSTGFSITGANGETNQNTVTYASWTFREQPNFFDIVTYTGTGSNTTIAHSLGAVPGSIIVKRTDTAAAWAVYHRSLANTQYLVLNTTAAAATGATWWNSTTPTSTVFSLGTDASVNASGGTYVAYLFAHDAGGFGTSGTDNVISCGSFTTDGSGNATVSLGWEPQFFMRKNIAAGSWTVFDSMRAMPATVNTAAYLLWNSTAVESANENGPLPTAVGASLTGFAASETYIYIAIRRGPMKVPTLGTSVFALGGTASSTLTTSFAVDAFIQNSLTSSAANSRFCSRLQGSDIRLVTSSDAVEGSDNGDSQFGGASYTVVGAGSGIVFGFGRAPGFFDEVCYTGTGATNAVNHNLAAPPEMIIVKGRNYVVGWTVGTNLQATQITLGLNSTSAENNPINNKYYFGNGTITVAPSATQFTVLTADINQNGNTFVAYLFATLAGVSKVGSYTGTGTTLQIDCGFTGGARFVLIKRTDDTGDWYVWDSARGIVAGNDPYLLLNSTAAEVTSTDYVDTYSAGFEISSTAPAAINASAGTFVFLAIA